MDDITFVDVALRFLLGGGAIVASTVFARRLGGTFGGVFAAFPAVYLAALIALTLDGTAHNPILASVLLSRGALIGMLAGVVTAIVASCMISRVGWKLGLGVSLAAWATLSFVATLALQRI